MDEIITINGEKSKKSNCRLIDKEYYLIGNSSIENSGDVYLIDGRYIRMNTGKLVFNNTSKTYQLKNDNLVHGIIKMGQNSDFVFGYFNKDVDNLFLVDKDRKTYVCINESIINRSFREELSSGNFYHISLKKAYQFNLVKTVKKEYKESLPYDSKGMMQNHINRYDKDYNPKISSTIEKYSKVLKGLTFGFEFETIKGVVPDTKLHTLPLIPLRDGSIAGLEYVTIPLTGSKGIKALMDCVKELSKRTEYNNDCSLHLHIGNVPRTPEFILAFYKVITHYQEEIFSLFPLYKKYNFGIKRKNYSEPFPFNQINSKLEPSISVANKDQVNKNFDVLFSHLSGGQSFYDYKCDLNNVKSHPSDPQGNQKWNIKKRYYAHNFIPLIFGNKETIEFRIHTPTYDIDKILNFLFINSYLINYAIDNQDALLSDPCFLDGKNGANLDRLICNYYININYLSSNDKDSLINYHLNYIGSRKNATYNANCKGDIIGKEENIYCYKSIDWNDTQSGLYIRQKPRLNRDNNYGMNDFDDNDIKSLARDRARVSAIEFKSGKIDGQGIAQQMEELSPFGSKIVKGGKLPAYPKRTSYESDIAYLSRINNWEKARLSRSEEPLPKYSGSIGDFEKEVEKGYKVYEEKAIIDEYTNKLKLSIVERLADNKFYTYPDVDRVFMGMDYSDIRFGTTLNSDTTLVNNEKPIKNNDVIGTDNAYAWIDEDNDVDKNDKNKKVENEPAKAKVKSKFWS